MIIICLRKLGERSTINVPSLPKPNLTLSFKNYFPSKVLTFMWVFPK